MLKFWRNLKAWFWCVRADWAYPEWRTLHHVIWVWKQINDDWFKLSVYYSEVYSEGVYDACYDDYYDPYYDEG